VWSLAPVLLVPKVFESNLPPGRKPPDAHVLAEYVRTVLNRLNLPHCPLGSEVYDRRSQVFVPAWCSPRFVPIADGIVRISAVLFSDIGLPKKTG